LLTDGYGPVYGYNNNYGDDNGYYYGHDNGYGDDNGYGKDNIMIDIKLIEITPYSNFILVFLFS